MSLESIIKSIEELDLSKKDLREIIKISTEKKRSLPNLTGPNTRKKKRGKSAWNFFMAKEHNPRPEDIPYKEWRTSMGEKWANMDDEEKQPFNDLAIADKLRIEKEMDDSKEDKSESDGSDSEQPSDIDSGAGVGLEDDAPDFEDEEHPISDETHDEKIITDEEDEEVEEVEEEDEEVELVEPIKPVKNKSEYDHFKEIYVSEHHERKYKKSELKKIWNELEDKSEYQEMAKADKRRYKTQKKEYEIAMKKYEKAQMKSIFGSDSEDLSEDE